MIHTLHATLFVISHESLYTRHARDESISLLIDVTICEIKNLHTHTHLEHWKIHLINGICKPDKFIKLNKHVLK